MYYKGLSSHEGPAPSSSAVVVVETTELLEEDKGEDSVGSEARVVGSEPLPQTEEPFIPDQFTQDFLQCVWGEIITHYIMARYITCVPLYIKLLYNVHVITLIHHVYIIITLLK